MADVECQKCYELLTSAYGKMNQDELKVKELQSTLSDLKKSHFKAINCKDFKLQAEALQRTRSEFRLQIGVFTDVLEHYPNLNQAKEELQAKVDQAEKAVRLMTPSEASNGLQTRVTSCRKVGMEATNLSNLEKQILEASTILVLAGKSSRGISKAEEIQEKLNYAKQLAKDDPTGPEARMIQAFVSPTMKEVDEKKANELAEAEFSKQRAPHTKHWPWPKPI